MLDDAACQNLFFPGRRLREEAYYREFGRRALRALLNPDAGEIEAARCRFLDDPQAWAQPVKLGPSPQLRELIDPANSGFDLLLADVTGDQCAIVWWAGSGRDGQFAGRLGNLGAALSDMAAVFVR